MSSAACPAPVWSPCQRADVSARKHWLVIAAALVVGLAFFMSEHSVRVSLAEAYTQSAEEMEVTAEGGNAFRRLAFLGIAGFGLILLALGKERFQVDWPLAAALGSLLALAGLSFLWCDDAGMCLRRLTVLVCCVIGAAGIARRLSIRDLSHLTILILGTLAIVGVLAELSLGTFRPWASDYRFAGTVHPNTQGPALAGVCLAAFGLAGASSPRRGWYIAVLVAALGLLILTKSRTSTAGVLIAMGAVLALQTSLKFKAAACLAGVWAACLGLWLLMVAGYSPLGDFQNALLLGRAEESSTLSGRAFIWPEVAYFIRQRPWLGYGYESFWTPDHIETISDALGWGLREAHNAYLEVILSLGFVGLALGLVTATVGFQSAWRGYVRQRDPAYALPLGLLVFGLLNATLESGMVVVDTVTFLLGCCFLRMALFKEMTNDEARMTNAEARVRGHSSVVIRHLPGGEQ